MTRLVRRLFAIVVSVQVAVGCSGNVDAAAFAAGEDGGATSDGGGAARDDAGSADALGEPLPPYDAHAHEPLFLSYTRYDVPGLTFPDGIAVGDIDGDGRGDVVVSGRAPGDSLGGHLFFLHGKAGGGFVEGPRIAIDGAPNVGRALAVADVTGDGRADVIVASPPGIVVFPQSTSGALGASVALTQPGGAAGIRAMTVVDVNGDGKLDVVAIQDDNVLRVLVYLQAPSGGLGAGAAFDTKGYSSLAAADMNGDGLVDIVTLDSFTTTWTHLQQPDGTFGPPTQNTFAAGEQGDEIAAGDIDGDGRADLVMTINGNQPRAKLAVRTQAGMRSDYPTLDIPTWVGIFDVDGDGRNDVTVLHDGFDAIGIYLQKADGTLAGEEKLPYLSDSVQTPNLAVGDVTGDGHPDLAGAIDGAVLVVVNNR
jgi:hypothetical protein